MHVKYHRAYMECAEAFAKTSAAVRLKVGCVIVSGDSIISEGLNGTPRGFHTNICEVNGHTRDEVVHAEMNALMKAARLGRPVDGARLYVTHAPCINCAKHVATAGISEVYYKSVYRDPQGLLFLENFGVKVYLMP